MAYLDILAQVLASTIRLTVPLLFACLAGLYSERSGVFDIGLEGKMLIAAFAAGAAASVGHSPWLGLLAAVGASVAFALLHGFAVITHRGDQIVSGLAVNVIAVGLTAQVGNFWFQQGGQTPQLEESQRFLELKWPFAADLAHVPLVGQIYSQILSGHSLLVYFAFAMVPVTSYVLFRTRFGLRLRAVGENPAAADTAGISVTRMRYLAVVCCGVLCGFAGTSPSCMRSIMCCPLSFSFLINQRLRARTSPTAAPLRSTRRERGNCRSRTRGRPRAG